MSKKTRKQIVEKQLEIIKDESLEAGITKKDLEEENLDTVKERKGKLLKSGLNLKEEEFCQTYISHDRDLYGNGTKCYLEVYGEYYSASHKGNFMSYKVAQVLAYRLLRKVKIIERINELLEEGGFNDQNVDKQHLFLLNQHSDLKTKLGAIKEYNAVKKRVAPVGVNIIITPEQKIKGLEAIRELIDNGKKKD